MAASTLGFWIVGYGLMFGLNRSGWIGTSDFALQSSDGGAMMNLFYQLMFAATCATIVSGAVAERMRFNAYLIGSFVVTVGKPKSKPTRLGPRRSWMYAESFRST